MPSAMWTYSGIEVYAWLRLSVFAVQFDTRLVQCRLWPFHRKIVREVQISWKYIGYHFVVDQSLLCLLRIRHLGQLL
jgi:hypothetical protein